MSELEVFPQPVGLPRMFATVVPDSREEIEREWMAAGLCLQTDPEAFFPEKGGSTRDAKRVCGRCDVRERCLAYALEHDERFGIWGGMSPRDRKKIKEGRA